MIELVGLEFLYMIILLHSSNLYTIELDATESNLVCGRNNLSPNLCMPWIQIYTWLKNLICLEFELIHDRVLWLVFMTFNLSWGCRIGLTGPLIGKFHFVEFQLKIHNFPFSLWFMYLGSRSDQVVGLHCRLAMSTRRSRLPRSRLATQSPEREHLSFTGKPL